MFKYKIFPDQTLVVVKVFGKTKVADVLSWINTVAKDQNYQKEYDGIVDYRDAEIEITPEEFLQIILMIKSQKVAEGKWVNLTERPIATALAAIYKEGVKDQHESPFVTFVSEASTLLNRNIEPLLQELENENAV